MKKDNPAVGKSSYSINAAGMSLHQLAPCGTNKDRGKLLGVGPKVLEWFMVFKVCSKLVYLNMKGVTL
jgi:hypothetical protein